MKSFSLPRLLTAAGALVVGLSVAGPSMARDWDNNPPGWRGGPGTNWENPPGWRGGPGASPDRRWHYHRPHRHWVRDRDDNPPGWRGGPGTNWENPPGRRGGPGASPDRRPWRWWW